jgi:hypothetical protein
MLGDRHCDRRLSDIDVEHFDETIPASVPVDCPGDLPLDLAYFGYFFRHVDVCSATITTAWRVN